mgnify:CR=1 FL=1
MEKPLSLRNTVWIFLALAMVAAPHAERLPLWVSISAAALGLWRLYIAQRSLRLLSKWLLLPMLGAADAASAPAGS